MSIRQSIIEEMQRQERECRQIFYPRTHYSRQFYAMYCTWWFSKRAGIPTDVARRELLRMERDGIVVADRGMRHNTRWMLVDEATQDRQS